MVGVKRNYHIGGWIFCLLLLVVVLAILFNRQWIFDFYRGVVYQPSAEMARIRSDLGLTEKGEFLFNAAQPELNEDTDFNNYCRNNQTETAILGCYVNENIHIYNITDEQLNGIRELTSAHELLHVVFARMSDDEKNQLKPYLDEVYKANQEILAEDLNNYTESEKFEELYVRAGTEVANLPNELEKHYGEIFKDQDKVVKFYDGYITVFKNLKAELDALKTEMDNMKNRIDEKTAEYERRVDQLSADIVSFNACAETAGCFKTQSEFYSQRTNLVYEQNRLEAMYNEINGMISEYNEKVEIYNADVLQSEKLNTMINSNNKPKKVE